MTNGEDLDELEKFEREDTKKKLPIGWLVLYFGLIAWGIFYFISYTPSISGWSQAGELKKEMATKK